MALDKDKARTLGKFELVTPEEVNELPDRYFIGDETVIRNPLYDRAFEKLNELHIPRSKVAFLSMCTGKRPYYKSAKWKKYMGLFPDTMDYIVTSNGGLIPEDFWYEYIYLIYDAPARNSGAESLSKQKYKKKGILEEKMIQHDNPKKYYEGTIPTLTPDEVNQKYIDKLYYRLMKFFKKHDYEYVFGDFTPEQRAYKAYITAMDKLVAEGYIKGYETPESDIKDRCKELGYLKPHGVGRMFPTLHSLYLKETKDIVEGLCDKAGCSEQKWDIW